MSETEKQKLESDINDFMDAYADAIVLCKRLGVEPPSDLGRKRLENLTVRARALGVLIAFGYSESIYSKFELMKDI